MNDIAFVDSSTVELIQRSGGDDMVCHAAWVSNFGNKQDSRPYGTEEVEKWESKTQGLINFLYRNRHNSPFEHASMTFYIETPIFVAREFMRHRTWSYNEMSGRYTELPARMFLINSERPVTQTGKIGAYRFDTGTPEQYGLIWKETTKAYQTSWNAYQAMLAAGVAKEVARNVLPVGMMTQFYATANMRNIMQFLTLRNDDHALAEIREVAVKIEEQFANAYPKVYSAFKAHDWRNERVELEDLRARVAQLEAELTYPELYATV